MEKNLKFDKDGMYEEVTIEIPKVFGARADEESFLRYKEYRKWFTVTDKNTMLECYARVMEQCHLFDRFLEGIFHVFRFNTKARSNKAWLEHVKELYYGYGFFEKKDDFEELYVLIQRESILKEYFFCSNLVGEKRYKEISSLFYECYISFFDGRKKLKEIIDNFGKNDSLIHY